MTYNEVYITLKEYREKYLALGKLYEGFVIDCGYAYTKAKAFQPAHMNGYSPKIGRLYDYDSHYALGREQHIDTSIKARKLSLRGLFKLNVPFAKNQAEITVKQGMTLSGIAVWFDVTVAELVEWNNLKDPNRIFVGQKIIIMDKHNNTLKTNTPSKTNASSEADNVLKVENDGVNSKKEHPFISATTTDRVTYDWDMIFLNTYSFGDHTVGDAKIFNSNFTTNYTVGKSMEASVSFELDLGLVKGGFSKSSVFNSISVLGYVEAETSINYESFWDMSINFEVRQNINKDNSSTRVGVGIKPVKVVALVLLVAGAIITAPINIGKPVFAPASVTPIVPSKEVL